MQNLLSTGELLFKKVRVDEKFERVYLLYSIILIFVVLEKYNSNYSWFLHLILQLYIALYIAFFFIAPPVIVCARALPNSIQAKGQYFTN